MKKALLCLVVLSLILSGCGRSSEKTDAAMKEVNAIADQALKEIDAAIAAIGSVKTEKEAVAVIDRFVSVVQQLVKKISGMEKKYPSSELDADRMRKAQKDFQDSFRKAGMRFGQALTRMPPDVLESNGFKDAVKKLQSLRM